MHPGLEVRLPTEEKTTHSPSRASKIQQVQVSQLRRKLEAGGEILTLGWGSGWGGGWHSSSLFLKDSQATRLAKGYKVGCGGRWAGVVFFSQPVSMVPDSPGQSTAGSLGQPGVGWAGGVGRALSHPGPPSLAHPPGPPGPHE